MKKSIFTIIICTICVFVFQAFTTSYAPQWQNLEILPQDISEDGLDSVMHHFTASLGVKCSYCHVRNTDTRKMDFANDGKPEKLIARKMMLMAIDINRNHFNDMEEKIMANNGEPLIETRRDSLNYMLQYVTCYTCHQGAEHPDNTPPEKEKK